MARLFLLLADVLPKRYHGSFRNYSIRELTAPERISIEDYFFKDGERLSLPAALSIVVFPDAAKTVAANAHLSLIGEFALALLSKQGHPKVQFAATFDGISCIECERVSTGLLTLIKPMFVPGMSANAAAQWVYRCSITQAKHPDRFSITARRYIRFSRFQDSADALLDLCISLESLLDTQTEIAFRFGLSLVKTLGERGAAAEKTAQMFSVLYSLRSKLAHGDPAADKLLREILKDFPTVRKTSRRILVIYVLFLGDHSLNEWKAHLKALIYA